jgi:hypothetical protein
VTRAGRMAFSRESLLGPEAPSEVEFGKSPTTSSLCEERVANDDAGPVGTGSPRGAGAADGDTAPTGGRSVRQGSADGGRGA